MMFHRAVMTRLHPRPDVAGADGLFVPGVAVPCRRSGLPVSTGVGVMLRLVLLALAGFWLAMPSRVEAAGGAYLVDDADIGKPGSCQNEAWLATATHRDFTAVTSPACVFMI